MIFVFWQFCLKFSKAVHVMGGMQSYRHTFEVIGTPADMKIGHRSDF